MVLAGTFAIHTIFVVAMDVVMVTNPRPPPEIAPHITMVEVQVPRIKPPPPPVQARTDTPAVKTAPSKPQTRTIREPQIRTATPPPPPSEPPPSSSEPSGGAPTVAMPDVGEGVVAVRPGPVNRGAVGRGGKGTGTGAGSGDGTATIPPPTPVSVATIKTRAMPKGDYGYIKEYPAEARQLGIEGPIRVRLVVDDKGKVKSAVLLNKLGHGLDELALERSKVIEFEPAKDTDDKPVSSVVVWTFNMTLPK